MKKKAHKPPSKIRYDQSHPTVSVRVTRELYDQLKELRERGDKSLGDILKQAVKQQKPSTTRAYNQGYNYGYKQGYDEAKSQFAVGYKCSACGGNLTVTSYEEKKAIAQYMRGHGWRHGECAK